MKSPFHFLFPLTFPDPPNILGNTTFVHRGSRQCGDGEHPLLQLQSCKVFDMFKFPRCRVIPKRRKQHRLLAARIYGTRRIHLFTFIHFVGNFFQLQFLCFVLWPFLKFKVFVSAFFSSITPCCFWFFYISLGVRARLNPDQDLTSHNVLNFALDTVNAPRVRYDIYYGITNTGIGFQQVKACCFLWPRGQYIM